MKSNVPWSVKGIDHDARSVAKELARQRGMTLGEWMTAMIKEQGLSVASGETPAGSERIVSGVSTDQLRAVVDTLNRLNERLQTTESVIRHNASETKEAMGGLNQGLETMFERVKRLEAEAKTLGDGSGLTERLDRLEDIQEKNTWVKSLVALEKALSTLVEQVEHSREETEERLQRNEDIVSQLKEKLDIDDDGLREDVASLLAAIETTTERVNRTEEMVSQALDAAKAASSSQDETFVERTSQRLQLLGNEIKRTSDQIRVLESSVSRLSEKIEAGEERSAEGISRVAQSLDALRREVEDHDLKRSDQGSVASVASAVEEADRRMGALEGAFSSVVAKLGGKVPGYDDIDPRTPTVVSKPLAASPTPRQEEDAAEVLRDFDLRDDEDEFDRAFEDPLAIGRTPARRVDEDDQVPPHTPKSFGFSDNRNGGSSALAEKPFDNAEFRDADRISHDAAGSQPDTEDRFASFFSEREEKQKAQEGVFPFPSLVRDDAGSQRFDATSGLQGTEGFDPAWLRDDQDKSENEDEGDAFHRNFDGEDEERAGAFGSLRSMFGRSMENNPPLGWVVLSLVVVVMLLSAWRVLNPPNDGPQIVSQPPARSQPAARPAAEEPVRADPTAIYAAAKEDLAGAVSREEVDRAIGALTRAAREGSVPAQYDLGELYLSGEGVPTDPARAREWFLEAASGGHVRAIHRLALLDIEGIGGPIAVSDALSRFEQAANAGLTDAMFNLGTVYLPSNAYLPENRRSAKSAYFWFSLAGLQGDQRAATQADDIRAQLSETARGEVETRVAAWRPTPLGE
ncbi:MAG: hypothetical protein V2I43_08480 [Parvularcula sp.]|nr:hypothetical protein [Parvularcula sp.]